jgi:hypothetical protein
MGSDQLERSGAGDDQDRVRTARPEQSHTTESEGLAV